MSEKIESHKVKVNSGPAMQFALPTHGIIISALSGEGAADPLFAELDDKDGEGTEWSYWGVDNNWPTEVREKIEKSSMAYPMLFKAVSLIYGNGVRYFRRDAEDDKEKIIIEKIPEIDQFIKDNRIGRFMLEQLMDYKFYGNTFSELILTKDLKEICNIYHKEAEFTRISAQNKKTLRFDFIGYSGLWHEDEINVVKIPFYDRYIFDQEEILKLAKAGKKFAYQTYFPSPGRKVYGMPPHSPIYRKNGWLDYSNSVPETLNAMTKNQMAIKYHIKIPYDYWPAKYPKWNDWDQTERDAKVAEEIDDMNKFLVGKDNVQKALVSFYGVDPITRKALPGWEIIVLDDKTKKDDWIPSAQEADIQVARAIGIDSSLSGVQAEGGKLGAGSGSDKRVGLTNSITLSKAEEEIIFEPLYLIRDYNGWPEDLEFKFAHTVPTTLDKNPTGEQNEIS